MELTCNFEYSASDWRSAHKYETSNFAILPPEMFSRLTRLADIKAQIS